MKTFFLALLVLQLFSCQTAVKPPQKAIVSNNANDVITNPAVIQLWNEAEQARKQQNYPLAEKKIEAALRILPEKAILWSRMAELAMLQKQPERAEDLAHRSNAYAGRNIKLLKRNWMVIRFSRSQRNDEIGARQAQLKIQKLAHYE